MATLFRHGRIEAAPGVFLEGQDQVRNLYDNSTRLYEDGTPRTRHTTTNVAIDEDDEDDAAGTANARSCYTVFQQTDELPLQPITSGHYHDSFHRVDGEWCFDTRQMFVDLTGDLSHHLLFELRCRSPLSRSVGNRFYYSLARSAELHAFVGELPELRPDWTPVFNIARELVLAQESIDGAPVLTTGVKAKAALRSMQGDLDDLEIEAPSSDLRGDELRPALKKLGDETLGAWSTGRWSLASS